MKEKISIKLNESLISAMKLIDKSGLRCLLVIDENNIFKGTLTDGDIRRYILNGKSIESSIQDAFNSNSFFLIDKKYQETEIKEIFLEKKYDLIPILDSDHKVKKVYIFDDLFIDDIEPIKLRNDIEVIIMAGGLGTRLLPLTEDIPKPLIPINNKPIIQHVFENFYKYGIKDFIISVNHMSDQIISFLGNGSDFNINVRYIHEEKPLGTCGSLSLIDSLDVNKDYIITNADVIADIDIDDFINQHRNKNADISVCTKLHEVNIPFGVVKGAEYIETIEEKPNKTFWINSGIYMLKPKMLDILEYNKKIDMPDFIKKHIKNNSKVAIYPITGYWKDIGQTKELDEARNYFKGMIKDR